MSERGRKSQRRHFVSVRERERGRAGEREEVEPEQQGQSLTGNSRVAELVCLASPCLFQHTAEHLGPVLRDRGEDTQVNSCVTDFTLFAHKPDL